MNERTDESEELASLVADLVRIESENPPGDEADCARFVHEWFETRDVDAELVEEPYPERPQVAAVVGRGDPTVVLNGHLDVVPAGDPDQWQYPPYGGERVDDRIYGRGSADMKTGLAVAMLTLADFRDAMASGSGEDDERSVGGDVDPDDGTLVFHGAIGEETGEPGTEALLDAGYDGDYGVVLEPTDFRVATRAKGLVCYRVTVHGEASHASRPDQGENAVLLAQPVLDAIAAYDRRVRERTDELVGSAYANVTEFAADVGGNLGVLPGEASFVLDRRVLPGESVGDVETEVDSVLAEVESNHGVDVSVEEIQRYAPTTVPTDCRLAELFRAHTEAYRPDVEAPWGIEAATDVRNLVRDAGMEAITWGPGRLAAAHTVDEHVELAAAGDGRRILRDALADLLEVPA